MSLSRSVKSDSAPKVEINIVPLVDVALVLLIIVMVTATFTRSTGINLQLPASSASRQQPEARRELVIGIASNGQFLWDNQAVDEAQLTVALLTEAKRHGTESRVTVRGDARATHGRVVDAMSLAQSVGFSHLIIATKKD